MHNSKVQRPKSQAGFTLIELLVVVAIIAVLISILLPALAQARESAKALTCSSKLKSIGTAMTFYGNDFNDRFPPIYDSITRFGGITSTSWAEYFRYRYLKDNQNQSFYCPSAPESWGGYKNACNYGVHYGLNIYLAVWADWIVNQNPQTKPFCWSNQTSVEDPDRVVVSVDSVYRSYLTEDSGYYTVADYGRIHRRHAKGANILFADGHVALIKADDNILLAAWVNPLVQFMKKTK